jgi:hypothetical protein
VLASAPQSSEVVAKTVYIIIIICKIISRLLSVGAIQINGLSPYDNNMLQVCFRLIMMMIPFHEKTLQQQQSPLIC